MFPSGILNLLLLILFLSEFDKSFTLATVFKCRFNELKQKYFDFCHMYTDKSKVETKTASAYVCPYRTKGYRLRDSCSISLKKWKRFISHGTDSVSEIGALHVPWNSMELLVSEIGAPQVPWNSTEFHGTVESAKLAHFKFHGIPWNCSCQRHWRTPSSNEFHGTACILRIGALQFPWNSRELLVSVLWNFMEPIVCYLMEPMVSSMHWVLNWDRIPWNLSIQILMKIILIVPDKLISVNL